jgi:hypothetical protein
MGSIKLFEEFEVWKTAREITCRIYSLTRQKAFAGDFALRDQIQKSINKHYEQHCGGV